MVNEASTNTDWYSYVPLAVWIISATNDIALCDMIFQNGGTTLGKALN